MNSYSRNQISRVRKLVGIALLGLVPTCAMSQEIGLSCVVDADGRKQGPYEFLLIPEKRIALEVAPPDAALPAEWGLEVTETAYVLANKTGMRLQVNRFTGVLTSLSRSSISGGRCVSKNIKKAF